jgi:hypothetical protein
MRLGSVTWRATRPRRVERAAKREIMVDMEEMIVDSKHGEEV